MSLVIQTVQREDFDIIVKHKFFDGGDLVPPPMSPLCWPVKTPEEAGRRLEYSTCQQRQRFLYDSTTRFMKVVDASTSPHEIISMARWHYYPEGYEWRGRTWQDMDSVPAPNFVTGETQKASSVDPKTQGRLPPEEFNTDLYNFIVGTTIEARGGWHSRGPSWQLTDMITRQGFRKHGAATMLIDWGVEQAQEAGVPAYLEASVVGKPVYQKRGFEQVGQALGYDCTPYGAPVVFEVARMVRYPTTRNIGAIT